MNCSEKQGYFDASVDQVLTKSARKEVSMIKLLEVLREELKKRVKYVQDYEADSAILLAMGDVIERKGLHPDLSDPKTIDILKGSSNDILEIARRSIWTPRKRAKREEARRVRGDSGLVIDVVTPTEFLADDIELLADKKFQEEQITKQIWYVSGSSTIDVAIAHAKDRQGGVFNVLYETLRQSKMNTLKAHEKEYDKKLGKHSAKIQELILEHDGEDLTDGEISRILGIPLATVKKRRAEIKDQWAKAERRIKKENLKK
jgi:DNA-directed RNA polymerase specialized sigma24 family protein